jgi:hypothetical protein
VIKNLQSSTQADVDACFASVINPQSLTPENIMKIRENMKARMESLSTDWSMLKAAKESDEAATDHPQEPAYYCRTIDCNGREYAEPRSARQHDKDF